MTSSCFKIISCGNKDSFDNDEGVAHPSPQGKDKRGWSFRKRSARHRVLSNTVTSETPSSENKATPVSAGIDFNSDVHEKVPAIVSTEEKPKLSTPITSKFSETISVNTDESNAQPDEPEAKPDEPDSKPDEPEAKPDEPDADSDVDESVVIIIQSAVRTFLAQKMLYESKNIIKLQAAVRGHLERRHALGTLRCVQAIIKMQTLFRARHARILEQDSIPGKGKENARKEQHITYTSIEKLLSNKFAGQLMDSTPRTKSMNIKCDPLKSDSAWKWLERWMAVSPTDDQPPLDIQEKEIDIVTEEDDVVLHDKKEDKHIVLQEQKTVVHDEKEKEMENFVSQEQMVVPPESKPNLDVNSEAHEPTSELCHNLKQLETPKADSDEYKESVSQERSALENTEGQGEKLVVGARKASNPNFLAAQSKFKELSSVASLTKSMSSASQTAEDEYYLDAQSKFKELSSVASLTKSMSLISQTAEDESYRDAVSSFPDPASMKESAPVEDLLYSSSKGQLGNSDTSKVPLGSSDASKIQRGGSECGTELSITSTLDSPERSDVGPSEFELESRVLEDTNGNSQSKDSSVEEAKVESAIIEEAPEEEQKPETDVSKLQIEMEPEKGNSISKSSPEASPRSHITASEPQGTPSSEVSVKPKRAKGDKTVSNHKLRSSSAGKTSPSGGRSSAEQSHKEHKSAKRRNSFGSPKPEHVDQEPRDSSSSSNPLPSYMQPTESARAKALLSSSSPRSSPDVLDKDASLKKRHSLPGGSGRQASPQVQRTLSEVTQTVKGNESQPQQDKKWRR